MVGNMLRTYGHKYKKTSLIISYFASPKRRSPHVIILSKGEDLSFAFE